MLRFKKRIIHVILLTILSLSICSISYTSIGQSPTYSIDYPPTDIAQLILDFKPIPIQAILDSDLDDDGSFELVKGKPTIIVVIAPDADYVEVTFEGVHDLFKTAPDVNGNYLFYSDPFEPQASGTITGKHWKVLESKPTDDNLDQTPINVKETFELSLYYSHVEHLNNKGAPKTKNDYGTVEASLYYDMWDISTSFIEDTYPVTNVDIYAPIRAIEGQSRKGYQHMLIDAQAAKENAVLNEYGNAIGVGICPDDPNADYDYFEYHKKPDHAGVSFGPDVKGVLALEGYYTMVAHEVAHTFGLYYPGLEQYQLKPLNGEEAVGLRVVDGTWRSGFCFMGTAPLTLLDSWVCNYTWEELFRQLKDPLADPEILLANGVIYKNNTVEYLRDWYRLAQGTPDILYPGNYSLVFLDRNGDNITETSFDAQFFVYVEPKMCATRYESKFGRVETDFAGFAFTAVYPSGTEIVEIWNNTDPAKPFRMSLVDADAIKTVRADAGGPYIESEGTMIVFNASGSIGTYDRELLYRWDFEGDGVWDTVWSKDPTAEHTWYDDWEGFAVVNVTDDMTFDTDISMVNVTNVDPIVEITSEPTGLFSEAVKFLGSIIDPGSDDTYTVVWDFGDGITLSDVLESVHTYEKTGFHTVTLTVTDDDGGIGSHTIRIYAPGKNVMSIIFALLFLILCAIGVIGWQYRRLRRFTVTEDRKLE
jgi:hypothetical protein